VTIETGGLVVQGPAAWSPDSSELAFAVRKGSREHSIYRVRRTGGALKRIVECGSRTDDSCELDWSPDGTTLAIADWRQGHSELYLFDLASGRRRDLIAPDKVNVTRPRFSPNGKWIAYSTDASLNSNNIFVVPAPGGRPRRITQAPWFLKGFVWSIDGESLTAIASRRSSKLPMWQFPLDGSAPYPVGELDADRSSEPTLSRRKGSFAWVRDLSASSLWRMPADESGQPPEQLVNSAAIDVDAEWSSNGRMVFRSDRSGASELWIAKADGTDPWQATWFRGTFVGDPHWSPDGRTLAFTTHADGNPDIFVMRCDLNAGCGTPRQLTRSPASDTNPTWSADGRWIYFSSSRTGNFDVWRMPADGGAEPERITWNGGYLAQESADGKWLYYSKLRESTGFWRIALPARGRGQLETPVTRNVPFKAAGTWALGARALFYYPAIADPAVPFPPVGAVDLETGRTRELAVGNIRLARGLSLSSDERWLLCTRNDRAQTLIMIAE
jgi:Tol biopolymer transport system component